MVVGNRTGTVRASGLRVRITYKASEAPRCTQRARGDLFFSLGWNRVERPSRRKGKTVTPKYFKVFVFTTLGYANMAPMGHFETLMDHVVQKNEEAYEEYPEVAEQFKTRQECVRW